MAAQTSDPAHEPMVVAKFAGSGTESIQAMATDSAGNIYVAGTTSSADFPVLNSTQPFSGDGTLMRSTDLGMTWTKLPNTIPDPRSITPHPSDPMILFCTGGLGIYKTSDGGKSWRQVFSWSVLPPCLYCNDVPVAIDPADPRYVYGIGSQTVGSIDGGDSWHVLGSPPYLPWAGRRPLWVDPWGSGAVGYGMSLSRDRGLHWTNVLRLGRSVARTYPRPGARVNSSRRLETPTGPRRCTRAWIGAKAGSARTWGWPGTGFELTSYCSILTVKARSMRRAMLFLLSTRH